MASLPPGRPAHHPSVASRTVSGEAVVVSPEQAMVRMFNEVGTRIWELSDGSRSPAQIAEVLVTEFEVTTPEAEANTADFLLELDRRSLLVWVP